MFFKLRHKLFPTICCWIIFGFTFSPFCFAESVKKVISVSPAWNDFTNKDGSGLYHDILKAVFTPHNIQVAHKYTNAKRGIYMVENNLADIYTCIDQIKNCPGIALGKYPMYEGRVYAIFKKEKIKDWQGLSSLENRNVVWQRGYYQASDFKVDLVPVVADSGISALGQVVVGRADFYVDDLNLIRDSIFKSLFTIDMDGFCCKKLLMSDTSPFWH
ncbi:MAG: hypothetical protein HUK40_12240 [Desulfobacter sp.]|nr:hypothetical protein [Desulfobacter sp.]